MFFREGMHFIYARCNVLRQADLAEGLQNDPVTQRFMAFGQSSPVEDDCRIRFRIRF